MLCAEEAHRTSGQLLGLSPHTPSPGHPLVPQRAQGSKAADSSDPVSGSEGHTTGSSCPMALGIGSVASRCWRTWLLWRLWRPASPPAPGDVSNSWGPLAYRHVAAVSASVVRCCPSCGSLAPSPCCQVCIPTYPSSGTDGHG